MRRSRAIDDYLLDHEGGDHSPKTLEWHRTALGLMRTYFEQERGVTAVGEVEAADINAWFASMRKTPSSRGKVRAERMPGPRETRRRGYRTRGKDKQKHEE